MSSSTGLRLSLLLNAVLVLALGWTWRPQPSGQTSEASLRPQSDLPEARVASGPGVEPAVTRPELARFDTEDVDWSRFSTGDWALYRDQLLACGCPRATVREIIEPLVNRHFAGRFRAWAGDISTHFWERFCPPAKERKEAWQEELDRAESEYRTVLDQLFPGDRAGWANVPASSPDPRVSFLPPNLARQVEAAEANRNELVREANETQSEPQFRAELIQQAEAAFETEFARILSPEQLAEWKARTSNGAQWVASLVGVDLSPTELAEIARLKHTELSSRTPAAEAAANEHIKTLLGSERFAAFERAQDNVYGELVVLSERTGLPEGGRNALWRTQRDFKAQAEKVAADSALTFIERSGELKRLRAEQEAAVGELLLAHPGAFEAWRRQQADRLESVFSPPAVDPVKDWLKQP